MKWLLIIALVSGCVRGPVDPKQAVIARVNGEALYLSEYLLNYEQLKSEQDDISQKNPKLLEDLKTRALNEVILAAALRQEGIKRQIKLAKEEVEGRLENWKEGYPPGGFEEMLRKQNTTEDFLKKRISEQILVEKLTEALFATETLVSDEEMKKYYNQHEGEFSQPERVHVFQIVVPTAEEAQKIRNEVLAATMTFESAARKYSLSPDAAKGGDLGFFSRGEKISAFDEAFSLSVGAISKPIQSRYGIHLLKVVEKQPSKKLGFNDSKSQIAKALKRGKEVRAYKEWATKLLKDGEIYRNEKLFESII